MRFNEQAKQGLMKEKRNKTKCGLRRAHLCIWPKTFLREWERRKARVLEEKRDCCVNPSICSRSCKKEEGKG